MDSSDDEQPLARINGVKSKEHVSPSLIRSEARQSNSSPGMDPGISLVLPHEEMKVDSPIAANGSQPAKLKRRVSATNGHTRQNHSDSGDDKDIPLSKRRKTSSSVPLKPGKPNGTRPIDESDSDEPLGSKLKKQKAQIEKKADQTAKSIRAMEDKSPKNATPKPKPDAKGSVSAQKLTSSASVSKGSAKKVKKEEPEDEIPLRRKSISSTKKVKVESTPAKKVKAESTVAPPAKSGKAKSVKAETKDDEEEAEDEENNWWENPMKGDGTKKWTTLEHNGVVFPPPYEVLPTNVKLLYDGVPVTLAPEAEEIATFYGGMLHSTVNVENPTFNKNFFEDFKEVLDKTGHGKDRNGNIIKIKQFAKCDFKPIFEYFDAQRTLKKALPAEEKKRLKAEKDKVEAPYLHCMWDGRKQKVGNFRVEPPSLFRGRGEHPKTGRVKKRVMPEQITINVGKEAVPPAAPEGHKWKEIKHDQEGTWLAMWQENINGAYKYVMLAANSDIKAQSDWKKFEKARELKKHIDRIRRDYRKEMKSELMADRQRATAMYLIDQFALRAGNEKGEDEADTVGCCSLKFEHVTLKPPNTVVFDFLGKDSIRFHNEFEVDRQVFKNLSLFKKAPKVAGDEIFDRLSTAVLNKHLSSYMPGLTAKVFRTYNASWTFSQLLKEMENKGTIPEKVAAYNSANRQVAIICNHKRTVGASHEGQMEKLQEKISGLRYQQWRTKMMMIDLDPKIKKKKEAKQPDYFKLPEGLDEDWVKQHQAALVAEQRDKIEKKFKKENEKLLASGEKEMKAKELQERLEAVTELEQKFKKENKSKKVEAEGRSVTIEKLEANVDKLSDRIEVMKVNREDKDSNKEVALGTSKTNYIDPRLTVVFSKKFGVPLERMFSKTLREKFEWAVKSVDENWEF